MKTIFLFITFSLLSISVAYPQEKKEREFETIRSLVESNRFKVEVDRALTSGGRNVDLFSNKGYIEVNDSIAKGFLPFFGRAYSVPYGKGGGIEFDNRITEKQLTLPVRKKRKILIYNFTVKGENDTFRITLHISSKGSCSVSVVSSQRSTIHYNGQIQPLSPVTEKE